MASMHISLVKRNITGSRAKDEIEGPGNLDLINIFLNQFSGLFSEFMFYFMGDTIKLLLDELL
jgi:hypothetical protein